MSLPCPGSNGVREMLQQPRPTQTWWQHTLATIFVALVILPLAITLPLWGRRLK